MNREEDDYQDFDDGAGIDYVPQTFDTCGNCNSEVNTTGHVSPQCPNCGAIQWLHVHVLSDVCPIGAGICHGQKSSLNCHVCDYCLDEIAIHERTERKKVWCVCPSCEPRPWNWKPDAQPAPPPKPAAAKPKNPFDDDIDDWL